MEIIIRPLILAATCFALTWACAYGQTAGKPSFEVASIKPSSLAPHPIECSGGPGTSSPGIWRCSNVPLAFLISRAYGFQPFEFSPRADCCQTRFDATAKVPAGSTKEQFELMLQDLLVERFKLTFHHEQKEMAVYELTVSEKGSKLKQSAPGVAAPSKGPWTGHPPYTMGKDGYPVFAAGQFGLAGGGGHYRWTGIGVSMKEIVKTVSYYLGGPVVDDTGLPGEYDIDMTWTIDLTGRIDSSGNPLPETSAPYSPTLMKAVHDQLGLQLHAKKGPAGIVVVDHVAKVPIEN